MDETEGEVLENDRLMHGSSRRTGVCEQVWHTRKDEEETLS